MFNIKKIVVYILYFFMFFIAFSTITSGAARIIYVDADGTGNYNTDGIDDHKEIQWALDNASKGDTVHLNASTYILNGTIWANNSGITIEGDGSSTNIEVIVNATANAFPQNIFVFYLNAANQTLKNIYFDGNWHNPVALGQTLPAGQNYLNFIAPNADNILIDNITIIESLCDSIRMPRILENITIRNSTIIDASHSAIQVSAYNSTFEGNTIKSNNTWLLDTGIRIYDSYNSVFRNNNFIHRTTGSYWNSFQIHSYGNKSQQGLLIENNTFDSNGHHGIWINSVGGVATTDQKVVSNITIRNNIFRKTPKTTSGYGYGIHVQGNSVWNNLTIINNMINGSVKSGISFEKVLGQNNVIKNNIIINSTNYGIENIESSEIISLYNDIYGSGIANYFNVTHGTGDISDEPIFNNISTGDFHLRSANGRWDGTTWVYDSETSPAIGAGDPASDNSRSKCSDVVEMGAYGNTPYSSCSKQQREVIGLIKDRKDESPLPSSTITLYHSNGTSTGSSTLSGADGTFRFINIPSGVYFVNVTKQGYVYNHSSNFNVTATTSNAGDITLHNEDVNGDGHVDELDLYRVIYMKLDLNGDKVVDSRDVLLLSADLDKIV